MGDKRFIASSEIYDIYQDGDKAVRIYKGAQYKEKCLRDLLKETSGKHTYQLSMAV